MLIVTLQAIDVFETSDLPEVDQHMFSSADSDPHDNVEILPITTNEAFGRFKGSYIDSKTVDFSEKLRKERRQGECLSDCWNFTLHLQATLSSGPGSRTGRSRLLSRSTRGSTVKVGAESSVKF